MGLALTVVAPAAPGAPLAVEARRRRCAGGRPCSTAPSVPAVHSIRGRGRGSPGRSDGRTGRASGGHLGGLDLSGFFSRTAWSSLRVASLSTSVCCWAFSLARIAGARLRRPLPGSEASVDTSGRVSETPLRPGAMGRTHLFVPLFRRCVAVSCVVFRPWRADARSGVRAQRRRARTYIVTVCSRFASGPITFRWLAPPPWRQAPRAARLPHSALPTFPRNTSSASAYTASTGLVTYAWLRGTVRWRMYLRAVRSAARRARLCDAAVHLGAVPLVWTRHHHLDRGSCFDSMCAVLIQRTKRRIKRLASAFNIARFSALTQSLPSRERSAVNRAGRLNIALDGWQRCPRSVGPPRLHAKVWGWSPRLRPPRSRGRAVPTFAGSSAPRHETSLIDAS